MKRKALVLDIDGTLTNSKKEITKETKAAIREVQLAGHAVILASGRPTPGMRRYVEELELEKYGGLLLSYNGAHVEDCATGEVLLNKTLPVEIPAQLWQFAYESVAGIMSYDEDVVISAFEPDEYISLEARINGLEIRIQDDFPEYMYYPVCKCIVTAADERAAVLEKRLQRQYGDTLSIYRSEPFFLEVMPKNTTKAIALEEIRELIGVERKNFICCGDGFNDIPMLEYAGVGVAMGNARQPVKDAADYITGTNDEDGLTEVIKKFIFPRRKKFSY